MSVGSKKISGLGYSLEGKHFFFAFFLVILALFKIVIEIFAFHLKSFYGYPRRRKCGVSPNLMMEVPPDVPLPVPISVE